MRVAAVTIAYNEEETIRGTLRCVKPLIDKHVVVISEKPYFNYGGEFQADRTEEIAEEEGADVVTGTWTLDHHQRNFGISLLPEYDWILQIDSDEMIEESELEKLLSFIEKTDKDAVATNPIMYWRGLDRVLNPKPTYQPIIALRQGSNFTYIRNVGCPFDVWDGRYHHFTWAKSDESIYKKVTTYAHATDCNWIKWYNEEFLKSTDSIKFPNIKDQIYTFDNYSLPPELKEMLCEYKL